ncbi:hypothetical protein [Marinicellulosiphila megalodicopiae]|uniref:hypothetical protein n=1 Tax=Marinicellulosiphila megalodicopiae TaxID=2724896 RepID=UPI003BB0CF6E
MNLFISILLVLSLTSCSFFTTKPKVYDYTEKNLKEYGLFKNTHFENDMKCKNPSKDIFVSAGNKNYSYPIDQILNATIDNEGNETEVHMQNLMSSKNFYSLGCAETPLKIRTITIVLFGTATTDDRWDPTHHIHFQYKEKAFLEDKKEIQKRMTSEECKIEDNILFCFSPPPENIDTFWRKYTYSQPLEEIRELRSGFQLVSRCQNSASSPYCNFSDTYKGVKFSVNHYDKTTEGLIKSVELYDIALRNTQKFLDSEY